MAFTSYDNPSEFFGTGYSRVSNTSITLTDALTGLTDAMATSSTGDTRKVIFRLMEMLYNKYAAIPVADRPLKLSMNRVVREDTQSASGEFIRDYTISIKTLITGVDVSSESTV